MKAVIIYYSYSGNNESLAKELRLRLGCDIVKIQEIKRRSSLTIMLDLLFKREPKIQKLDLFLKNYKTVVFISPIWNSKIATPLSSYLKNEGRNINSYSFITLCGGRSGQREKITKQLFELTGKMPITVAELSVNDLLPADKRNQVKYVSAYRATEEDLHFFRKRIQDFVNVVSNRSNEFVDRKQQTKVLSGV